METVKKYDCRNECMCELHHAKKSFRDLITVLDNERVINSVDCGCGEIKGRINEIDEPWIEKWTAIPPPSPRR